MFNKLEIVAGVVGVLILVVAFLLLENRAQLTLTSNSQLASAIEGSNSTLNQNETMSDTNNNLAITDVKEGSGNPVEEGNVVTVHYVGTFTSGQEFDSSKKRSEPLTFRVGAGNVIKGWEEGLLGMRVGGERVLTIPPALAYGERGIGPIPPNATLNFTIELLAIDND